MKLADGEIGTDLAWLVKLDALVAEPPDGQNRRLRNGERDRLERLLDRIQKGPPRRAAASAANAQTCTRGDRPDARRYRESPDAGARTKTPKTHEDHGGARLTARERNRPGVRLAGGPERGRCAKDTDGAEERRGNPATKGRDEILKDA